jgi:hypothetical protein
VETAAPAAVPGAETWKLTLKTPMGPQEMTAQLVRQGDTITGRVDSPMGGEAISEGKASGDKLSWIMQLTKPAAVKLSFDVKVAGDQMSGKVKFGMFGSGELSGRRV